jgi:hypothetical protein
MDGKAPCIAEAARRLLRSENTILSVPSDLFVEAQALSLAISDGIPKMIREPTVVEGGPAIVIEGLAQLAGEAPGLDICWVPGSSEELWTRWIRQVSDLISAGYPGCVGCGGPGSEGPWDEAASRARAGANAGGT